MDPLFPAITSVEWERSLPLARERAAGWSERINKAIENYNNMTPEPTDTKAAVAPTDAKCHPRELVEAARAWVWRDYRPSHVTLLCEVQNAHDTLDLTAARILADELAVVEAELRESERCYSEAFAESAPYTAVVMRAEAAEAKLSKMESDAFLNEFNQTLDRARKAEEELASANELNATLRAEVADYHRKACEVADQRDKAEQELSRLRSENERLKKAAELGVDALSSYFSDEDEGPGGDAMRELKALIE